MKAKPKMKREVAVVFYYEAVRHITFYSTQDAVTEFAEYGDITPDSARPERYTLSVDSRFDFGEVLAYIQNYG